MGSRQKCREWEAGSRQDEQEAGGDGHLSELESSSEEVVRSPSPADSAPVSVSVSRPPPCRLILY